MDHVEMEEHVLMKCPRSSVNVALIGVVCSATNEFKVSIPDSKVHGPNMGPTWGRQDPGGPQVDPMKIDIWVFFSAALRLATGHSFQSKYDNIVIYLSVFHGFKSVLVKNILAKDHG